MLRRQRAEAIKKKVGADPPGPADDVGADGGNYPDSCVPVIEA